MIELHPGGWTEVHPYKIKRAYGSQGKVKDGVLLMKEMLIKAAFITVYQGKYQALSC